MPAHVGGLPDPSRLLWGPSASCPLPFTAFIALNYSYLFTRSFPPPDGKFLGAEVFYTCLLAVEHSRRPSKYWLLQKSIHRVSGSERGFKVMILQLSEGSPCAEEAGRWTGAS